MSTRVREFLSTSRGKVATALTSSAIILATALPLSASADEVTTTTSFPITSDMLAGVTNGFNSAVAIAVPVGVSIMAIMIGIGFVPKLIKKFTRG